MWPQTILECTAHECYDTERPLHARRECINGVEYEPAPNYLLTLQDSKVYQDRILFHSLTVGVTSNTMSLLFALATAASVAAGASATVSCFC